MRDPKTACWTPTCKKQATTDVGGYKLCLRHAQIHAFNRLFQARSLADYPIVRRIEER